MILVKDVGMEKNKSGNSYRTAIYMCPECKKESKRYVHNVKQQEKRTGGNSVCDKCTKMLRNETHGQSKTQMYSIYKNMRRRCLAPTSNNYHNYGGRGISICDEWLNNIMVFKEWFDSNYIAGCELDRINNDGNYEPSNCRFVNKSVNAKNRRDRASKTSLYKYVVWDKKRNKWIASVYRNKKRKYLGSFEDDYEAHLVVKAYLSK